MKAWAVLIPFLCIHSRRLDKRSSQEVKAPPVGYLPSQDYADYEDDLAGYSVKGIEIPSEKETTTALLNEGEDNTTMKPIDESSTDSVSKIYEENQIEGSGTRKDFEKEEEEDELFRYNAGADDLVENDSEPRIKFEQPAYSYVNAKDDETTTNQPNENMLENMDELKDETNNTRDLDKELYEDNGLITENAENGYGAPEETGTLGAVDNDTMKNVKKVEESVDLRSLEEPNTLGPETMENLEEDEANLKAADINLKQIPDHFTSLCASIKICPGGSMTTCVSVCPGTSTKIYGACVQGCAERCEGQDPR